MAEDLGEKTEKPTSKRLSDARMRGNIAKSQDLSGVVLLLGVALVLAFFGRGMIEATYAMMRVLLIGDMPQQPWALGSIAASARIAFYTAGLMLAPVLGLVAVAAYLSHFIQVGWLFTFKPLAPKLNRLSPASGFKRIFGKDGLVKTGTGLLKLAVVLPAACYLLYLWAEEIVLLATLELPAIAAEVGLMALELCAWLIFLLLVAAILDMIYQRYQHKEKLKMTKQEVKDERKSMEGDVQARAKRLQMGRNLLVQRINSAVPQADVVVTNPTHYAVALKYQSDEMRAPRVVAKGADFLAMRIREVASSHGVPIVERPPLARALFAGVEVGQEVPPEQYEAVAELLAYVYRLEGRTAEAALTAAAAG
ncbi:MAG: flagellar biosynthesis protein FlhB [Planctomycetota bacterium]